MGVDSAFLDLGSGCLDPLQLFRILRLVIFGQLDDSAISTQGRSWVPCIGNNYPITDYHDNISSAAHRVGDFAIGEGLHSVLDSNFSQFLLALLRIHELVELHKDRNKGLVVVTRLIELASFHHDSKVIGAEMGDLATAVAIEHSK